ncbi:hypothetical protein COSO111634_13675 [Corallococcus soli]
MHIRASAGLARSGAAVVMGRDGARIKCRRVWSPAGSVHASSRDGGHGARWLMFHVEHPHGESSLGFTSRGRCTGARSGWAGSWGDAVGAVRPALFHVEHRSHGAGTSCAPAWRADAEADARGRGCERVDDRRALLSRGASCPFIRAVHGCGCWPIHEPGQAASARGRCRHEAPRPMASSFAPKTCWLGPLVSPRTARHSGKGGGCSTWNVGVERRLMHESGAVKVDAFRAALSHLSLRMNAVAFAAPGTASLPLSGRARRRKVHALTNAGAFPGLR